jgi:hypothetical protein
MRYSSGDAMFEGKGPMAFAKNPEDLIDKLNRLGRITAYDKKTAPTH